MKRFVFGALTSLIGLIVLLTPAVAFGQAAPTTPSSALDPVCQGAGAQADVCSKSNNTEIAGPNGVIVKASRLVSVITGVAAVIMIMVGGFKYVTSTGDSARVNSAKNTILYAIIGLAISVMAPFIIGFVISKM